MEKEMTNTDRLQYNHIYLSELREVVDVYKKQQAGISHNSQQENNIAMPITEHFGLPLVQVTYRNIIVGFASAVFNASGRIEIRCFKIPGQNLPDFEQALKQNAEKVLLSAYANEEERGPKVKAYISRLISWLNWCD